VAYIGFQHNEKLCCFSAEVKDVQHSSFKERQPLNREKRDYFLSMNESLGSEQPAKLEVRQFYAYSMSTVMASCHNAKRAPFLEAIR
jgi:hypothetical protein